MKAKINRNQEFQLNLEPHNISFTGADGIHILTFSVKRFPRKLLIEHLSRENSGEIRNLRGSLRIVSKKQGVNVNFDVSYEVVNPLSRNEVTVTSKEHRCFVLHHAEATREEKKFIRELCAPYMQALDPQPAAWFRIWAAPSLAEVCEMLDASDKRAAAELLYTRFISV